MKHEYACPVCKRGTLYHRRTTIAEHPKKTLGKASFTCDKKCGTTLILVSREVYEHWRAKATPIQKASAWLTGHLD